MKDNDCNKEQTNLMEKISKIKRADLMKKIGMDKKSLLFVLIITMLIVLVVYSFIRIGRLDNSLKKSYKTYSDDLVIQKLPIPGSSLASLSFEDFIDSKNLSRSKAQELQNAGTMVKSMLKPAGYDFDSKLEAGVPIVKSVKSNDQGEYSVVFTDDVGKIMNLGKLIVNVDKELGLSKTIIEDWKKGKRKPVNFPKNLPRGVPLTLRPPTPYEAALLLAAAIIIIELYEIKSQLKEINRKLDDLIEGREIDKKARLKAIYYNLQHVGDLSPSQRDTQLAFMHKELMELRYNWIMEMEHELVHVKDDRNKFCKIIGFKAKKTDDKNYERVSLLEKKMLLIDGCIKIDAVVCGMSGIRVNVDHELEGIRRVRYALDAKYDVFIVEKTRAKTKEEMNVFFNMLESDCKAMFNIVAINKAKAH